ENLNLKLSQNNELLSKIEILESLKIKVSEHVAKKQLDFDLYKTLSSIYSPTGAQAYILDSVVDSFNSSVSKYVDMVWPLASYTLTTHKETSKGDVVAKFSETLIIDGKEVSMGS